MTEKWAKMIEHQQFIGKILFYNKFYMFKIGNSKNFNTINTSNTNSNKN